MLILPAWSNLLKHQQQQQCKHKSGGTALSCPTGNTCCAGGCIPSDLGRWNGTCCDDGKTGCGVGYVCSSKNTAAEGCTATKQGFSDPLEQFLPRYRLCRPKPSNALKRIHGFPVNGEDDPVNRLVYYSSHGDIWKATSTIDHDIDMVLIFIHGANRNADDYFCAASAAVALSRSQNVMVVAPRFVSVSDGSIILEEGGTALRWSDEDNGPWRYGARSVYPAKSTISSFAAMDSLVQTLLDRTPAKVVVAGHSSGGQFVQRWSLLTETWSDNRIRAVVANPSSYAYLSPLRKINGQWQIPSDVDAMTRTITDCLRYNQWEWGLDDQSNAAIDDKKIDDEYKRLAMDQIGRNVTKLIQRFGTRDIVYMIGSLDRCNVSSSDGWCHSHGLETTCMDELQGSMRLERQFNYYESLETIVGIKTHSRITVEGVGHDHSLMFTQPEGLEAIFGSGREPLVELKPSKTKMRYTVRL